MSLKITAGLLLLNDRAQILLQLLKHISKLLLTLLGSWLCMVCLGQLLLEWKVTTGLSLLTITGNGRAATVLRPRLQLLWGLLARLPRLLLHRLGRLLLGLILLHQEGLDLT